MATKATKQSWLNPELFQFGLQLGSDPNFDFGPPITGFQDPYTGSSNPLAPGPTGLGGGQAQPWGGMPEPQQPMDMGGGYQQPTPQQQGPAGYTGPIMSDIDLRNNPYYDDGYTGKHPAWHRFLQYTGSPQFADSMMAGAIAANISTNPIAAMQQAIAFKQHRDQRAWQAQQNQLQRESQQENIKLRNEATKEQKKVTQFNNEVTKLDAALRQAKLNPDPIIAEIGPPTPENIEEWKRRVQRGVADIAQAEKDRKQMQQDLGNKMKILDALHKGSTIKDESVPGGLRKDPAFVAAMGEARGIAKKLSDFDARLKAAREKLLAAQTRNAANKAETSDPDYKVRLALAMAKLRDIQTLRRQIMSSQRGTQSLAAQFSGDPTEALGNLNTELGTSVEEMEIQLEEAMADVGGVAKAKGEPNVIPEPKKKTAIDAIRERLNAAPPQ